MIDQKLDPVTLRQQIIGADARFETPFGERMMVYADYTASGRGLHFIEDYLKQLQQLYANSHTEHDTSGRVTTQLLHQAERIIKRSVNAGPDGRVIAGPQQGNGQCFTQGFFGRRACGGFPCLLPQTSTCGLCLPL